MAVIIMAMTAMSCSVKKEPIEYGKEDCYACKMTIVDKKFGAELVTDKGKIYKFDAAECMIKFLNKGVVDHSDVEMVLVTDYSNPGTLINAKDSYFLISENLPSPMGAFLSSFSDKQSAEKMKNKKGGKIYKWKEIRNHIIKKVSHKHEH